MADGTEVDVYQPDVTLADVQKQIETTKETISSEYQELFMLAVDSCLDQLNKIVPSMVKSYVEMSFNNPNFIQHFLKDPIADSVEDVVDKEIIPNSRDVLEYVVNKDFVGMIEANVVPYAQQLVFQEFPIAFQEKRKQICEAAFTAQQNKASKDPKSADSKANPTAATPSATTPSPAAQD